LVDRRRRRAARRIPTVEKSVALIVLFVAVYREREGRKRNATSECRARYERDFFRAMIFEREPENFFGSRSIPSEAPGSAPCSPARRVDPSLRPG
jgi:hypothetical protein